MNRVATTVLLAALLAAAGLRPAHAQIYVDESANGANDGSSRANAYTDLQTAIDDANGSSVTERGRLRRRLRTAGALFPATTSRKKHFRDRSAGGPLARFPSFCERATVQGWGKPGRFSAGRRVCTRLAKRPFKRSFGELQGLLRRFETHFDTHPKRFETSA